MRQFLKGLRFPPTWTFLFGNDFSHENEAEEVEVKTMFQWGFYSFSSRILLFKGTTFV